MGLYPQCLAQSRCDLVLAELINYLLMFSPSHGARKSQLRRHGINHGRSFTRVGYNGFGLVHPPSRASPGLYRSFLHCRGSSFQKVFWASLELGEG